jgi:hypothetical protein
MNKKQLAEILKYSDPKRLYVVDWKNSIVMLICPFLAIVKDDIGELKARQIIEVDEVKVTMELITVFVVKNRAYFYYHFEIVLD